jgi:thiopurine S-methyltransferase
LIELSGAFMEPQFWHERWAIESDRLSPARGESLPAAVLASAEPQEGERVLVPLCGKSHRLLWLAHQGHAVVGVELSEKAVQDFFSEASL